MLIDLAHRELAKSPRLRDWRKDNVDAEPAILFEQAVQVASNVDSDLTARMNLLRLG